jgi:hypothetical protein
MKTISLSAAAALSSILLTVALSPAGDAVAEDVKPVQVVNSPIVQAAEHPARQAFYTEVECSMNLGDASCGLPFKSQIPRGKRLVIRTICITASVTAGQTVLAFITFGLGDSPTPIHPLAVARQGTFSGHDVFVGMHLVEISADGGLPLEMAATRSATTGSGLCRMAVSGYLVDCGPGPGCPVP